MRVIIKLFAVLRETAQTSELTLDLPAGATAAAAVAALGEQIPAVAKLLARSACAVNQSYVPLGSTLNDGDELAIIPPVSGG
jgi:molybdopterin converting factor subunit 1